MKIKDFWKLGSDSLKLSLPSSHRSFTSLFADYCRFLLNCSFVFAFSRSVSPARVQRKRRRRAISCAIGRNWEAARVQQTSLWAQSFYSNRVVNERFVILFLWSQNWINNSKRWISVLFIKGRPASSDEVPIILLYFCVRGFLKNIYPLWDSFTYHCNDTFFESLIEPPPCLPCFAPMHWDTDSLFALTGLIAVVVFDLTPSMRFGSTQCSIWRSMSDVMFDARYRSCGLSSLMHVRRTFIGTTSD